MSEDKNWTITDQGEITRIGVDVIIYGSDGDMVAGVCGSEGLDIDALDRARLIASAPDLLAALEMVAEAKQTSLRRNEVRSERDDYVIASSAMKRVKEAIARVKEGA